MSIAGETLGNDWSRFYVSDATLPPNTVKHSSSQNFNKTFSHKKYFRLVINLIIPRALLPPSLLLHLVKRETASLDPRP